MTATETALQNASAGLMYQSETDAPWSVVSWSSASGDVTTEAILKLGKHKAGSPTEEQSLDAFFASLVEDKDWYGDEEKAIAAKYRSLLAVIKAQLANPKVVRVGSTKVTIYVVGQCKEGGWAGLKTKAVET